MKRYLFILLIMFLIMPVMAVEAKDRTLYGVLKNEAESGGLARKYTGAHQDSFLGTGDKDIYHWYAETNEQGTAIQNKNNVIFAGHCWQMIRTTDTGGVKLIYNGEAENNQCLNTRGKHVGYGGISTQYLTNNYYYGTSYEYDSENKVFTLSGTITQETWNEITAPSLIGKYTCKQTTESASCTLLYLIESYIDYSSANTILLHSNSHYSQFGYSRYNIESNSPSFAGYMYNKAYYVSGTGYHLTIASQSSWTINPDYYYSDSIDWNTTNANKYTLLNPVKISTLSDDYSSLVGKYVLYNSGTSYQSARYVVAVSSNKLYYRELTSGDLITSITIGDSYTESGGVYTLTGNVKNISFSTWYNTADLSIYKGKYVCEGDNTSCTTLEHIYPDSTPEKESFYCIVSKATFSFGEGVSFDGTTYTLTGDIKTFWDFFDSSNKEYLSTHHYTCLWNGTSCTTVGYVNALFYNLYYILLSGVSDIEAAVNEMLYASDVNTKNSTIKTAIDAWYAKYMINYDSYLEDTVFCNDRTIADWGSLNPNGGGINNFLAFQEYNVTKDLSCDRVTDQFSTLNNSAKLTYKVGLMSSPELNLLNNNNARTKGQTYWFDSPSIFSSYSARIRTVFSTGMFSYDILTSTNGVRPAISLKPDTKYATGNGSMDNPYIVGIPSINDIIINNDNERGSIQINKVSDVEENSEVYFSINAAYGYQVKSVVIKDEDNQSLDYQFSNNQYTFVMPDTDVTITVTYEKVKSSVNVQIVNETKELNIEINDLTQVEYQEEVVFKVTPIKGYKLNNIKILGSNNQEIDVEETNNPNEYSFIMPAGDVTIIPSYEKVSNSVVVEDNPNTKEIVISVNDATAVVYEELVKVTVVPEKGYVLERLIIVDEEGNNIEYQKTNKEYEYSFIMPDTDVTITPQYQKVKNSVVVEDNPNTKDIVISVDDTREVAFEELVKLTIVPKDGYTLEKLIIVDEDGNTIEYQKTVNDNEYSFIMSYTNVTITPVYKKLINPNTGSKLIPIAIIFITIMGSSYYVIKKEFR